MTSRPPLDLPDQRGRRVVVTGATSGIGRAAATALAAAGAVVTLAVRDEVRGRQAAASMGGRVEVRHLDLTDLASVRAFAESWSDPLDVLIDNAGIMAVPSARTVDGFESQFGTNHLGHFALTNLLLPHVTDRVVVVASLAHRAGRIDLDDLNWDRRRYSRWGAYGQSKLANLLFVLELQRRLDAVDSPVRALAAHPGVAGTNLTAHTGFPLVDRVGAVGARIIGQSSEDGARPTLMAATDDLPGRTYVGPGGPGELRGRPRVVPSSSRARDEQMARRLWTASEELTGVTWPLGPVPA